MAKSPKVNYKYEHNVARVKEFIRKARVWSAATNIYSIIKCHVRFECQKLDIVEQDIEVRFEEGLKIGTINLKSGFSEDDGFPVKLYPRGLTYVLESTSLVITGSTRNTGAYKCTITAKAQDE